MIAQRSDLKRTFIGTINDWRADWCLFAKQVLGAHLDPEQQAILRSVQANPRTSVASGTARGKDFVSAVAALCFLYLTPRWNEKGELVHNTKVALTAPTGRQVDNIMQPEFARLFNRAGRNGFQLPGRLVANDIRTDSDEWYLTGFKADEHQHEAWSGFHAVNTMFIVTEASVSAMVRLKPLRAICRQQPNFTRFQSQHAGGLCCPVAEVRPMEPVPLVEPDSAQRG